MGAGVILRLTELACAINDALAMSPERMALLRYQHYLRVTP